MPNETFQYSNGCNLSKVVPALTARIGWQQPTISGSPTLEAANSDSLSGRFFNDGSFHSLVSVQNFTDTMEDDGANDTAINDALTSLRRAAVTRCLNGVFNTPEYIEQILLFDRYGYNDRTITNTGLFVGYRIELPQAFDISVKLDSLTLYFDSAKTFNIYLFRDGSKAPVWTKAVTSVAYEQTKADITDLILSYIGTSKKGERFFLGYFQDDLGSTMAVREDAYFNTPLCFSCEPMQSAKITGVDFDRRNIGLSNQTYGLNLEMSSFKDRTQQVVKNASLFDEVLGLTVAYMVLEQISNCTRSNATERKTKDAIDKGALLLDLNGTLPISDAPKVTGLKQRIERELARLTKTFNPKKKMQVASLC